MKEGQYDVAICDSFSVFCQDAAYLLNIPVIITSSMPQSKDAAAPYINNDIMNLDVPTNQYMCFWERVDVLLTRPIVFIWRVYNTSMTQRKMLKAYGGNLPFFQESRWKNSVKMYNTAFGIQRGRPLGPLVEFVGPIVKSRIPRLSPELEDYMSRHQRVAYVGFGQNAVLSKKDIKLLLTGILEAYENEDIDGVIWSTRKLNHNFPDTISTQSNKTYDVKEMLNGDNHGDILFLSWAPQMAILNHPSTSLNINHGGSASIYETLYAGVKMVVYPFFADQRSAVFNAMKNGYGLGLSKKSTQEEVNTVISTVARDKDGKFKKNAIRFKALIQIRSKHGVIKGADLVEEVLFLNEDGKVTHRRDVKDEISFLKATNLDVYGFAVTFVFGSLYSVYRLTQFISRAYLVPHYNEKQKVL
jgi:hypothetical protein